MGLSVGSTEPLVDMKGCLVPRDDEAAAAAVANQQALFTGRERTREKEHWFPHVQLNKRLLGSLSAGRSTVIKMHRVVVDRVNKTLEDTAHLLLFPWRRQASTTTSLAPMSGS